MKGRPLRLAVACAALIGTGKVVSIYESKRAVEPPVGWSRIAGDSLPPHPPHFPILSSAWRLGPQTQWLADGPADQVYVRAREHNDIGISLGGEGSVATWIWVSSEAPVVARRGDQDVSCVGAITPPTDQHAIELKAQPGAILVTWADQRMVCPAPEVSDKRDDARPGIRTRHAPASLLALGRDRRADGVPVSPLWWLSGLMIGGLLGMILLELGLSITRRVRVMSAHDEE